jgi:DNA-directed RNA polymerase sigma subunit (sigma70/sigma32)
MKNLEKVYLEATDELLESDSDYIQDISPEDDTFTSESKRFIAKVIQSKLTPREERVVRMCF